MSSMRFNIDGAAGLQVTLTEQADGSVRFDLVNTGSQVADLRGFFFDVADASILSSLRFVGAGITGTQARDDAVVNLGQGNTMSGAGAFDVGVAFGTAGIGKDDVRAASFTLSSAAGALDLFDFADVDFGVRFTSVGDEGGAREGSLKLVGHSPDVAGPPPPPPPPPPPGPDLPGGPIGLLPIGDVPIL